jgi:hypothetical protein
MLPALRNNMVAKTIQNAVIGNLANMLNHDEKRRTVLCVIDRLRGHRTTTQARLHMSSADMILTINNEVHLCAWLI